MILSPVTWTLWPSALAVAAYGLVSTLPDRSEPGRPGRAPMAWALLALAWLAQAVSIFFDTVTWDGPHPAARFGFAPALSVTSWLVLGVYALESRRLGLSAVTRRVLALLAAATVALAWAFPGQEHPSVESPWAPVHWVLGFASYGLIGAALMHAALMQHAERQLRGHAGSNRATALGGLHAGSGTPLLRLESLTLRFVAAGFVMLTLTLLLGAWSAHPWRWDHKAVFSVLSWLVFATLLIGRHQFGWRGRQAVRWLYAGSTLLLLAYVGSRFVMEVVLHRPIVS